MAVSITISGRTVHGNKRKTWGTGNLGTYVADGVAVTASSFRLNRLDYVTVQSSYDAANNVGTPLGFDRANSKIVALYDRTPAAAQALLDAATDSLALQLFTWEAYGT